MNKHLSEGYFIKNGIASFKNIMNISEKKVITTTLILLLFVG